MRAFMYVPIPCFRWSRVTASVWRTTALTLTACSIWALRWWHSLWKRSWRSPVQVRFPLSIGYNVVLMLHSGIRSKAETTTGVPDTTQFMNIAKDGALAWFIVITTRRQSTIVWNRRLFRSPASLCGERRYAWINEYLGLLAGAVLARHEFASANQGTYTNL